MRRNLRKIFIILLFICSAAINTCIGADIIPSNVYAVARSSFNSAETKENSKVKIIAYKDCTLPDIIIKQGDILTVILNKYIKPKRGKLNGYYKITLYALDGKTLKTAYYGTMRVSEPKDMAEIVEKAGITIAGAALKVPGFSQSIAAAKGIIAPNENETRVKSVCYNLYETTPLPLAKKGQDFSVETDGIVVLKLRKSE